MQTFLVVFLSGLYKLTIDVATTVAIETLKQYRQIPDKDKSWSSVISLAGMAAEKLLGELCRKPPLR